MQVPDHEQLKEGHNDPARFKKVTPLEVGMLATGAFSGTVSGLMIHYQLNYAHLNQEQQISDDKSYLRIYQPAPQTKLTKPVSFLVEKNVAYYKKQIAVLQKDMPHDYGSSNELALSIGGGLAGALMFTAIALIDRYRKHKRTNQLVAKESAEFDAWHLLKS